MDLVVSSILMLNAFKILFQCNSSGILVLRYAEFGNEQPASASIKLSNQTISTPRICFNIFLCYPVIAVFHQMREMKRTCP